MFDVKGQVHEDIAGISLSENEAMEDVDANEGNVVLDLFPRFASQTIPNHLHRRPSPTRCYTKDARTIACVPDQDIRQGTIILEDIGNRGYQTRYMLHGLLHIAARIRAIASSFQTVSVSLLYIQSL
jgi:hypothetical protein